MKRLYRDRSNKMIAGVCAGLAQYLEIDPVLVRVGFVLGAFANGIGILGYFILWVLVPQRPYAHDLYPEAQQAEAADGAVPPPPSSRSTPVSAATVFGTILIAVGAFALLDNLIPGIDLGDLWPFVLVAMGVGLILRSRQQQRDVEAAMPEPPTEPGEPRSYSSPLQ